MRIAHLPLLALWAAGAVFVAPPVILRINGNAARIVDAILLVPQEIVVLDKGLGVANGVNAVEVILKIIAFYCDTIAFGAIYINPGVAAISDCVILNDWL